MSDEIKELQRITDESDKIVFFGGAGVSTESGIPDFRSESGLYKAKQEYGYSPEMMLSHTFFTNYTSVFYDYYKKNLIYRDALPNDAHLKIEELAAAGKLLSVVTQNIDGLHQKAGKNAIVRELHGSVERNYCMKCGKFFSLDYILNDENCVDNVPKCDECGNIVKPDVVLYEEALNNETMESSVRDISNADLMIIGGTSLAVYPAAGLVNYFRGKNMVIINKQPTQIDYKCDLVISDSIGKVLSQIDVK